MNTTTSTDISRNMRGELRARSVIPLGFDSRELHIETRKRCAGGVSTDATVYQRTADGVGLSHAFAFGGEGDDFRRTVSRDPKARATEKTLAAIHAAALVDLAAMVAAACAHYGKPAPV